MPTDEAHVAWSLWCPDMPEKLRAAYARSQHIAATNRSTLGFALASEHYNRNGIAPEITPGDLHTYTTASSLAWQKDNNEQQLPPNQLRDELTAISHLIREKAKLAVIQAPAHPIPIILPAPRNRLDHVTHRDGMARLEALEDGMDALCAAGIDDLSDIQLLGLSCISAARHCGVLNLHEQRALARSMDAPIIGTGQWWHVDLQLTSGRNEQLELRRVFLSPYAAAVRIACVQRLQSSKTRNPKLLGKKNDSQLNRLMNASVRAFARRVGLSRKDVPGELSEVMSWQAARLRVTGMPLLEAYATRSIISHSVPLNVFRRWEGLAPIATDQAERIQAGGEENNDDDEAESSKSASGPHQQLLDRVRRIFRSHDQFDDRHKAFEALRIESGGYLPPSLSCLIEFGQSIASGSVRGCKRQKGVSISMMLYKLGPAWLDATDALELNALNQGDIESICQDILDQNQSPTKRARINRPLRQFLEFLEDAGYLTGLDLPEIPHALGLQAVSANVATPREAEFAAKFMLEQSGFASMEERKAAAAMVQVASRCGLRRNEILHVKSGDLHHDTLLVRPNAHRELKSTGSQRLVPLALAPTEARDRFARYCDAADPGTPIVSAALGTTEAIYEWRFFPIMNAALKQAINDPGFRFHHLRHGTATWLLVSLLAEDLNLQRFADRAEWLADAIKTTRRDKMLITGNSGPSRKALTGTSLLLGHSSPKVSIEHYTHCLDLLLHAQCDTSHIHMNAAKISGLLGIGHRSVQRWTTAGTAIVMSNLEKRFKAFFARDSRPLPPPQIAENVTGDQLSLFFVLEKHWLRMQREQLQRDQDPGRIDRSPSEPMGILIDALNHVHAITSDKRGNTSKPHDLQARNNIALPRPLRGGASRKTAMVFASMLHKAFMADATMARRAITVWSEHTSASRGFFRLGADDGSMRWLLGSGHLDSNWYQWGDDRLTPIATHVSSETMTTRPPQACYFRLSTPAGRGKQQSYTERRAIWWVLSMSYALIKAGRL